MCAPTTYFSSFFPPLPELLSTFLVIQLCFSLRFSLCFSDLLGFRPPNVVYLEATLKCIWTVEGLDIASSEGCDSWIPSCLFSCLALPGFRAPQMAAAQFSTIVNETLPVHLSDFHCGSPAFNFTVDLNWEFNILVNSWHSEDTQAGQRQVTAWELDVSGCRDSLCL